MRTTGFMTFFGDGMGTKNKTLKAFFQKYERAAVACSGGVDSAFLLYQAKKHAKETGAFFVRSSFQPGFEEEDAQKLCSRIGVPLTVISIDILGYSEIVRNPSDRCYFCKREIFRAISEAAKTAGFPVVLEGTNFSDDANDRPGMKALQELGVLSPLRECGYTKERIRQEAKEAGLFVHDKPAYACLATRIPWGTEITLELLQQIEQAENLLFSYGFSDFRVRLYGKAARIQLREEEIPLLLKKRAEIAEGLKPFFKEVFLDCRITR